MEKEKELSEQAQIQVYPNPADHLINFELDYTKSLDSPDLLVIRDVNGKLVHTEQVKNAIYYFVLNTNDWSSGSYYYEVLSQDKLLESGKIEIIH